MMLQLQRQPPVSSLSTVCLLLFTSMLSNSLSGQMTQPSTIRIQAGEFHRLATPVHLAVDHSRANWQVTTADGRIIPHQINDPSNLSFRVQEIEAGETVLYRYGPAANPQYPQPAGLITNYDPDQLRFTWGASELMAYRMAPVDLAEKGIDPIYSRSGYLHPIRTLSGLTVTDDYPLIHLHHHGLWSAWTKTRYGELRPDFWNMGKATGGVTLTGLEFAWEGPVEAGFLARQQHYAIGLDQSIIPVLDETWKVHVYTPDPADEGTWFFDLQLSQQLIGTTPLELLEHIYGGIGVRGNGDWNGPENARVMTSEGVTDRIEANGSFCRWFYLGGLTGDALAGLAVLDHPGNPRSPQPVRMHPKEPYFSYAPVRSGPFRIGPESPYQARYRVVVIDGEPDPELLDRLWNDFAHPPLVELE